MSKALKLLSWLVNLKIVPYGWLTKLSGWLAIAAGIACAIGHPIPGFPCTEPVVPVLTGTAILGLARRKATYPTT